MFKYLDIPLLPDITFVFFLVSWLATRQVMFLMAVYSTVWEARNSGTFKWDPQNGFYLTNTVLNTFSGALWILQALQCIWFWMICRVTYGVIMGKPAAEPRSDDEDECVSIFFPLSGSFSYS